MKIVDLVQNSPEWLAHRAGRLGASSIGDMLAKTKSGWGASRANLKARLIVERLTGLPVETYKNAAMQHGNDTEPQARAMYEFMRDVTVVQVGYVEHPTIPMAGCSPDGLVGDDGLLEIKCPGSATHIDILDGGSFDGRYVKQVQWQMGTTGRAWADLVSFDPRLPPEMQIHIWRVYRDDDLIAEFEKEARVFLADVDATIARLTAKYMHAEAAE
jgi:putative phage-type endonuclease